MSNIIDIFKAGGIKTDEIVGKTGFYTNEEEIYENSKLQQKFISSVDYSDPANFAKFGSAEEYYKQSIKYIAAFPDDGSSTEKLKWVNSLNEFEFHLFSNEYPRHTGSLNLSSSQYIILKPEEKTFPSDIKEAYLNNDKYKYETFVDLSNGITFESWLKPSGSAKFDVLKISNSGSVPYLQISVSSSNFIISSSATTQLTQHTIDSNWHHYAFRINSSSADLFVDGQRVTSVNGLTFNVTSSKQTEFIIGGTGSFSIDETRLWNGYRSLEKIGRFWFTKIDGNEKTYSSETALKEPQLIFYYKYNEGYLPSLSSIVRDSSGRSNHAVITNYSSYGCRSTESAINSCGFVDDIEKADIIVGAVTDSQELSDFYDLKVAAGAEYDTNNIHALYRKFPSWVLESEEDNEVKHLKQMVQVISVYFDDLYNKIGEISQYKHQKLTDDTDKIYPFYDKILTSTGFDVTELFSNLSAVEGVSSRDDLNLFDENTQKVKNQIYQNIYNNLAYILKSKGSEKSLKSLLRTYGVDENLVKINLYGDRGEYNVSDKYKERHIKKKVLPLSGLQYVSASSFSPLTSATAELQTYLPTSVEQKTSLLTVGDATVYLTSSNGNLKFQLSSSISSSLSQEFSIRDLEMPWNIAVTYETGLYNLNALKYLTANSYDYLTASISGSDVTQIRVGSNGAYNTAQTAADVMLWNTVLDVDTLKVHARDLTNYGIPEAKNINDSLVLYWDFDKVTASQVSDLFNTNSGQTSEDLSGAVEKRSVKTYKTVNYDVLDAEDTIQILDEDDSYNRSLLKKPSSTALLIENSMYQIISDEMINMFASINDYVFSFAEAGNLYKYDYKNLNVLRKNFFSKVLNVPDIEKYVEFYKWLDSSLGYMLDQLKPENSNGSKGLKNTIESHMLERNKYQYKLPLTVGPSNTFNMSASILRNAGVADKGILADSDNKKYSGMVQNAYVGPVERIENKQGINYNNSYEVLHTAGKQHNNRGDKENKTVFRTVFSSGDGLSELNRDSVTGGEYSIYNSLLNKSRDMRDVLDYSSSLPLGTQGDTYSVDVSYMSGFKEIWAFLPAHTELGSGSYVTLIQDIISGSNTFSLAGKKIIKEVIYAGPATLFKYSEPLGPAFDGFVSGAKFKLDLGFQDNSFVQRNIPYTASNYAHTTSVDYVAIPNELILNQHRTNAITASGIGYREPPVEWNVPMYHDMKVVGAFESMEILSPYSVKTHDFANFGLTNALKGVDTLADDTTFYRKVDGLDTGSVQVNRIEHLENVFPPRTLMGMHEIRSKPGYDEVSGSFTNGEWSSDSYNRNTATINSFWRTNEADRRRTRGMDNPTSYTGSINCLGEYNKKEQVSGGILSDRTGSVTGSQYNIGSDFFIKLQVSYVTNRYDSIYSMDSVETITYDD